MEWVRSGYTTELEAHVENARRDSLRIRQTMTDGLAQWFAYDSQIEAARVSRELGVA